MARAVTRLAVTVAKTNVGSGRNRVVEKRSGAAGNAVEVRIGVAARSGAAPGATTTGAAGAGRTSGAATRNVGSRLGVVRRGGIRAAGKVAAFVEVRVVGIPMRHTVGSRDAGMAAVLIR
jgi:hypothetical protein